MGRSTIPRFRSQAKEDFRNICNSEVCKRAKRSIGQTAESNGRMPCQQQYPVLCESSAATIVNGIQVPISYNSWKMARVEQAAAERKFHIEGKSSHNV